MKLVLQEQHLSIDELNNIELPEFTILTGVNGAGKSHLMQAIEQRKIVIEGESHPVIVHFNNETFKLDNESGFTAHQLESERTSAWNFFIQSKDPNLKGHISSWKNSAFGQDYQRVLQVSNAKRKPLWYLTETDLEDQDLCNKLEVYKNNITSYFINNQNLKGNQHAQSILVLLKKLPYSIDEIEEQEFYRLYEPYTLKNDFLPQQLGKVFWDYNIKFDDNKYRRLKTQDDGKQREFISDEDFFELYGGKPWEVVNDVLESLGSVTYRVNSPEELDREKSFQLKLIHTQKPDVNPQFNQLSSGERILMALVASVYKASSDNHFPDVLLLDEIDASLHPSMIRNLLKIIQNTFLEKGVKVILITHSPSTIALAPEESIFLVNRMGHQNRIEKSSRELALKILTEGFMTFDEGIKILEASKPCLHLEGTTDVDFLRKAKELGLDTHGVYEQVEIDELGGEPRLKEHFRFLKKFMDKIEIPQKQIYLFDCEVSIQEEDVESLLFKRKIPYYSDHPVQKGIENLFPKAVLEKARKDNPDLVVVEKITREHGGTASSEEIWSVHEDQKRNLCNWLCENGSKDDFQHFEVIFQTIKNILTAPSS